MAVCGDAWKQLLPQLAIYKDSPSWQPQPWLPGTPCATQPCAKSAALFLLARTTCTFNFSYVPHTDVLSALEHMAAHLRCLLDLTPTDYVRTNANSSAASGGCWWLDRWGGTARGVGQPITACGPPAQAAGPAAAAAAASASTSASSTNSSSFPVASAAAAAPAPQPTAQPMDVAAALAAAMLLKVDAHLSPDTPPSFLVSELWQAVLRKVAVLEKYAYEAAKCGSLQEQAAWRAALQRFDTIAAHAKVSWQKQVTVSRLAWCRRGHRHVSHASLLATTRPTNEAIIDFTHCRVACYVKLGHATNHCLMSNA